MVAKAATPAARAVARPGVARPRVTARPSVVARPSVAVRPVAPGLRRRARRPGLRRRARRPGLRRRVRRPGLRRNGLRWHGATTVRATAGTARRRQKSKRRGAPAHARGAADGTGGERWGEVGTGTSRSTSAPRPRWAIAGKRGDQLWVGLTTYMRPTGRTGISGTGVYATIN